MTMTMMTESSSSFEKDRAERRGRHWARRLALQALYQWDVSGDDVPGLLDQFSRKDDILRADSNYFRQLVRGVVDSEEALQERLAPILDRPMRRLDPVERAVLRFACYELLHFQEIPTAVILSEATQLAGKFGTEKGGKYVNAVLDRASADLRAA